MMRAVLWRKEGVHRIQAPVDKKTDIGKIDVLKLIDQSFAKWGRPREVADPSICKELLVLEETLSARRFKFGIIHCKDGQVTDDEFFGNELSTPAFDEFIEMLGDRIKLNGWRGYRAGLDTASASVASARRG